MTIASKVSTIPISINTNQLLSPISPKLFGAVLVWTKAAEGAADPVTGIIYESFVETVKRIGITDVRYGGGTISSTCFDWSRAIGPMEIRKKNRARHGKPGQASIFGPDELGDFMERADLSCDLILNSTRGNVQDQLNFISYMLYPADGTPADIYNIATPEDSNYYSPQYWGNLRAANGHSEPYRLSAVCVGNEEESINASISWRAGDFIDLGSHDDSIEITDQNRQAALYAFGGTTRFIKQPAVGYADLDEAASYSTGAARQSFYASFPPVAKDSASIYIDNDEWMIVDDLDTQTSDIKACTINYMTGEITFGDGIHGQIPAAGSQVTISYNSGPHEGFIQYYQKIKQVFPQLPVFANYGDSTFTDLMGDIYPYDGLAHHPLGVGFPSNQLTDLEEFYYQQCAAGDYQTAKELELRTSIQENMGSDTTDVVLTAYGHAQGLLYNGITDWHLNMAEALVYGNEMHAFINAGFSVGHNFLLNDTPYHPDTDDAPSARRWNALAISSGNTSDLFILTSKGWAFSLVSTLAGQNLVAASISDTPIRQMADGAPTETLELIKALAALDGEGNLNIILINNSYDQEFPVDITLDDTGFHNVSVAEVLTSDKITDKNTLTEADNVIPVPLAYVQTEDGSLSLALPSHSISRILLHHT